jgi:hypothetical protein
MSALSIAQVDQSLSSADEFRASIAKIHQHAARVLEEFHVIGMELKRLRDHELWKHGGYASFAEMVHREFNWKKTYAYYLIRDAELRPHLPEFTIVNNGRPQRWTEGSVRELLRLEIKDDPVLSRKDQGQERCRLA